MINKECIVLVGNIGTGKTTWVGEYLNKPNIHIEDYMVFSDDVLYYMLSNNTKYIWSEGRESVVIRMMEGFIQECCECSKNIIIDAAALSLAHWHRRRIWNNLPVGYTLKVIDFGRDENKVGLNRRLSSKENMRGESEETWINVHNYFKDIYDVPDMSGETYIDEIITIEGDEHK